MQTIVCRYKIYSLVLSKKMESEVIANIAKNIKKHRKNSRLSQEKLATMSGIHRTYISLLERKKKNVSIIILEKIALALNISICDLLDK